MLRITKYRRLYYVFSGILMAASLAAWLAWGLKPGIDFTGGAMMELEFSASRPSIETVSAEAGASVGSSEVSAQPLGENGIVLRMPTITEEAHQELLKDLKAKFEADQVVLTEKRFESVGPVIGEELRKKTIYAVITAILAIVLYITYVFRKVSHPVASWKYGVCTIVALAHDVIIPVGVFSALGHFHDVEVGAWIVTALLTVLGFSVHDTIVVFDRIRENLAHARRESFEEVVNRSMNETLGRSLNTSLTVLLVLATTYALGGASIRDFILIMIIGIGAGTYSSIFVASPLLVSWQLRDAQKR
ncbi:MAG TPA: protein translocase subunit SecF [Candidatus Baltobacteraceae bacterium]|jgi:preprotein translocase subunit SecF|nr:protein translocase subunit SecF [Candidatus Baltobacteraceae bacterium]